MKTKFYWMVVAFLAVSFTGLFAQKVITGTVSDETGPLPGVNITIKGTDKGTETDFDGKYSIEAKKGDILHFSYVGAEDEYRTVGDESVINVMMKSGVQLGPVVITAQGIKREKKALGYAVSQVSSEELEQKTTADIARLLTGKASGVSIRQASGLSGSGTQFLIRGYTSPGNNNPLFIVDGVPFDGSTNGTGRSESSRFIDLDPNNIESISILKGLSAATLYGSDGRNGVIIITTKNGKAGKDINKKHEISVNQSFFFNEIASFPDFTQKRGQGYYGAYWNYVGNWGAQFGNWGTGNVDEYGQIAHPYSTLTPALDFYPGYATERYDYKYYDRKNFFRTGLVYSTSINASGGSEKASYNANYSRTNDEGFIAGNELVRDAFGLGGRMKLSNNFTVSGNLNTSFTKFQTPFIYGIMTWLYNTPISIDLLGLPYQNPIDGRELAYRGDVGNPLWIVNNRRSKQDVTRTFGNFKVNYALNDNFSINYRLGLDTYTELNTSYQNKGNLDGDEGYYYTDNLRRTILDNTLMFQYTKKFGEKIKMTSEFGGNVKSVRNDFSYVSSTRQVQYGMLGHHFFEEHTASSAVNTSLDGVARLLNKPAVFAQATFDYDNWLFLTANGRNEWVSNFVNNSIFYPGVSLSFIPTNAIEGFRNDYINYIKLRAAYGSSAGFEDGYPTHQGLGSSASAFITPNGNTISTQYEQNTLANTYLKPFLISEIEFGAETKFLKNRLGINFSYYTRTTKDLIFERPIDPASGGTSITQNLNEFKSDGIELDMTITPVKTDNFTWDLNGFFTKNKTWVTELDQDRVMFAAPYSDSDLGNYLIEGEPVTIIMGSAVLRNENGDMVVTPNGEDYELQEDIQIIGDANPDFISSFGTSLKYKNLSFNMLWEYQKGGDIYSSTITSLLRRGITTDTDHIGGETGIILPGVIPTPDPNDPNETIYVPNNVVNDSGDAYLNLYLSADEFSIYDATTIRLQDVSLSYSLGKKVLDNTPFGQITITLSGSNLWYNAVNTPKGIHFDTNAIGTSVSSNGSGFEINTSPSNRRYGLSIKATF